MTFVPPRQMPSAPHPAGENSPSLLNLDLHLIKLERLIEIALACDLISKCTMEADRVHIYLGRLRLEFSRDGAHLYLRGLIRGHLLSLLQERKP